jgi:hypothetical protein
MPSTAETRWIDGSYDKADAIGDTGFLIQFSHEDTRGISYALRDTPAHTNQSHMPRLEGWCGTTNNVSTTALGAWSIVRVAKNGRILIQQITDPDLLAAFLEEHGYPDLA